jgi:hypothetical protein
MRQSPVIEPSAVRVMPANAGIHDFLALTRHSRDLTPNKKIPAFAGMTGAATVRNIFL